MCDCRVAGLWIRGAGEVKFEEGKQGKSRSLCVA